ncbi:PRC-barrel domain protein [Hasllibacter halocynthiae]|uniref:PRC-barrel domain protein n=1 Tax=Hasllibacter halocynthiae TaxID=595589 RepID=A0A2T0X7E6_9RHOB|nr:PRC-barrel domain-containing protein [Hasllibacter halocynthiae]PRY94856.1 PRC-barrel domain protein [Hasllibacter halocynthiae]
MKTKHLLGTVAIATLMSTGAMAQEMIDIDGQQYEALQFQMDGDRRAIDDNGNYIVVMADGTRVPTGAYDIDAEGTPYLIDREFAMADVDAEGNRSFARRTTADAGMGGQFIVEQADPNVTVDVPDPVVSVDQAQPEVTVQQPQPEITVTQTPPRVSVEQQAPVVTVEQDRPVVTVRIPEPVVTIRMPAPDVQVAQGDAEVAVDQPEPVVRFVRPEPQIRIMEAEPQVDVRQAEAQIDVNRTTQADVRIEQADAEVQIQEAGEPQVSVETADAEVNVVDGGDADIQVEQADAQIDLQEEGDPNVIVTDMATSSDNLFVEDEATRLQGYSTFDDALVTDLVGRDVLAADGEDIGEVDNIGLMGDRLVAIVGVGGFLGLGEHDVALPLERFSMVGDDLVVQMSASVLEGLDEYDNDMVEFLPADGRIGDAYIR